MNTEKTYTLIIQYLTIIYIIGLKICIVLMHLPYESHNKQSR